MLAAFVALSPLSAPAQQPVDGGGIVVIDLERLFIGTRAGQAIIAELDAEAGALAAENRQIEARLEAEEQTLTQKRPTMAPADFRARAEEFDQKVVALRSAQDAKARDLGQRREQAPQEFYQKVLPILTELAREKGASVALDARVVFLATGSVNITDVAISRIDAALAPPQMSPQ